MKPSERIKEIQEKHDLVNWNPRMPAWEAIIQYLDEQYEKNKTGVQRQYDVIKEQQKPCEHKNVNTDPLKMVKFCQDCFEKL